jgi:hypothetical protein
MASADEIEVQVVYATPMRQFVKTLRMPVGSSIEQAIHVSGLLSEFPELVLSGQHLGHPDAATAPGVAPLPAAMPSCCDTDISLNVGVYGEPVQLDACLQGGERVEIYRPLLADPKETRRRRAKAKKKR